MRTTVLAVGRTQPPYADDVQHYQKLLARHTRLELVEVREEQRVDGRIPRDAYVCLLAADGTQFDSMEFSRASSFVKSSTPIATRITPETAVMAV